MELVDYLWLFLHNCEIIAVLKNLGNMFSNVLIFMILLFKYIYSLDTKSNMFNIDFKILI